MKLSLGLHRTNFLTCLVGLMIGDGRAKKVPMPARSPALEYSNVQSGLRNPVVIHASCQIPDASHLIYLPLPLSHPQPSTLGPRVSSHSLDADQPSYLDCTSTVVCWLVSRDDGVSAAAR